MSQTQEWEDFDSEDDDSEDDLPGVTSPDEYSDVTLLVEENKLYSSRCILGSASPVWKAMFKSEFKEKDAKEIPLPGKSYDDVKEMLCCITPGILKPTSEETVEAMLALAEEYQMKALKENCHERLLLMQAEERSTERELKYANTGGRGYKQFIGHSPAPDLKHQMHLLIVAQTYNLSSLQEKCVQALSSRYNYKTLSEYADYKKLEASTVISLLQHRLTLVD